MFIVLIHILSTSLMIFKISSGVWILASIGNEITLHIPREHRSTSRTICPLFISGTIIPLTFDAILSIISSGNGQTVISLNNPALLKSEKPGTKRQNAL